MKIVTIVGARPQFIKAAVVARAFKLSGVDEVLVHTGQHYDANMSDVFFDELEISRPQYHLGIGSGCHGQQTGKMLEAIENVLLKEKPEWVLVYGDTNSTLAGSLAAVKLHIPVAHVEAGLRSYNRKMPEEINRVLTDHVSTALFVPTKTAVFNLLKEGVPGAGIRVVGDVMYDAALFYAAKSEGKTRIMQDLGLEPKKYILGTIHRAENTDDLGRLKAILQALMEMAATVPVVLPLHPRTKAILQKMSMDISALKVIEPVGYLDMVALEKNARLIATDSGGVQKEAFFYKVPCVTLRDETEWVELVESGWNVIVPPVSAQAVVEGVRKAMAMMGSNVEPYGKGDAARQIVEALVGWGK